MLTKSELDKLKQIPFCEIPYTNQTELTEVAMELKTNSEWYDYIPPRLVSNADHARNNANYKGIALTTFRPDKDQSRCREGKMYDAPVIVDGAEYMDYYDVPVQDRKIYQTSAASRFPRTMELIYKLTDKPKIAKIAYTSGRHRLWWHSHQQYKAVGQDYITNTEEQYIIHLPVYTHDEVYHMVSKLPDPITGPFKFELRDEYLSDSNTLKTTFNENKLYFFNSYLNHAYVNFSETPRLTLLIYNDGSANPTLDNLMRQMIESYTGPTVPDPWGNPNE